MLVHAHMIFFDLMHAQAIAADQQTLRAGGDGRTLEVIPMLTSNSDHVPTPIMHVWCPLVSRTPDERMRP